MTKRMKEETRKCVRTLNRMTDDELVAAALIVANRKIQERERRIASLEAVVDKQRQEIAALEPVSGYVNEILARVGTVTTTQISEDYTLSAQRLNKILCEGGVQRKVNGQCSMRRAWAKAIRNPSRPPFGARTGRQTLK